MSQLAKITDLFVEGGVLSLTGHDGSVLPVWINKLTPFEVEQVNHEGRIARARAILALKEIGSPEYDLFRASMVGISSEEIIDSLVNAKDNEFLLGAYRSIRSDTEWRERVEVLDWSSDQVEPLAEDDPQRKLLEKIQAEYTEEIQKRLDVSRRHARDELTDLSADQLEKRYTDMYLDERGLAAFQQEHAKFEVFYAMRQCKGTRDESGKWEHSHCDHSQKMLDDVNEVTKLPQLVFQQVRGFIQNLNMARDIARFSAALASSSAPSEPSRRWVVLPNVASTTI